MRGNWIKSGAVVIDVGINPVDVSRLSSFTIYFLFFLKLKSFIILVKFLSVCV